MSETILGIAKELEGLTEEDFDFDRVEANGDKRLYELVENLEKFDAPEQIAEILFRLMERLSDCDLGSPGPIVHTLEKLESYQKHLFESLKRKPTQLTVWMANRILNVTSIQSEREFLLMLLQNVESNPQASIDTKKRTQRFLEFQRKRHG